MKVIMPKYNIYKIIKTEEEKLKDKLRSVNLREIFSKEIKGFKFEFFYSFEPEEVEIWWTDLYEEFLEDIQRPKNKIYFGVLLISNSDLAYAVSLGKAYFYLKNFCDMEFGLNLAERIVDRNNMRIKNSKYFNVRKSKTITTYQNGSTIDYDSGESMQYIKAKTTEEEKWGGTVSFGNSVAFNIKKSPQELIGLINDIEEELKKPPKFSIPRAEIVKNEEIIKELNQKLISHILWDDSNIQMDELSIFGVDFVFTDKNQYTFYLKGSKRKTSYEVEDLNIGEFRKFILKNDIDLYRELENILVYTKNENGKGHSNNIKYFLDYVDDENYCLIDGNWYQFNQSYINYLETEVDKIPFDYQESDDLSIQEYMSYLRENELDEKYMYKERYFNTIKEKDGYLNFDRNSEMLKQKYSIEKMDLYKEKTLFFVKIGTPQKLGYVIDQCLNTVNILQNRETEIKIESKRVNIDEVCLWLVMNRKNKIKRLNEIESLIFLMKLVEWKKQVTNAGFNYSVKINYVRD